MIDPDVILVLLRGGPQSRQEIAESLAAPNDLVKHELSRLVRSGAVKRTGGSKHYALASYVATMGRPLIPGRQRRGTKNRQLLCASCGVHTIKHHGLCRSCARSAGVYTKTTIEADRDRIARRVQRDALRGTPQMAIRIPQPSRSCVVEGVEYDLVDYEALVERNAEHYPMKASSLAADFFDRPRFNASGRHEMRRGAQS